MLSEKRVSLYLLVFLIVSLIGFLVYGFITLKKPIHVAILGDSILSEVADVCTERHDLHIPPKYIFYDQAVPSRTSKELVELDLDFSNYDVVFIMIGFNDSNWFRTVENVKKIYDMAKDQGVSHVIYISTYHYNDYKRYTPERDYQLGCQDYLICRWSIEDDWKTRFADDYIWLRNYYSGGSWMGKSGFLAPDGLHLNRRGLRYISGKIFMKLEEYYGD